MRCRGAWHVRRSRRRARSASPMLAVLAALPGGQRARAPRCACAASRSRCRARRTTARPARCSPALDWVLAAAVLYVLLPAAPGLSASRSSLGVFLLAQVAGLVSHVPAGLGVFETVMVLLLAPWLPGDVVLGSVLAYRIVYYLMPARRSAVALFAGFEVLERRRAAARRAATGWRRWLPELVPRVVRRRSTFAAGVMLLLSGATPAAPGRIEVARSACCRSRVLELSHLLGSLVGVALLLLARALQQRVDAAYGLTLALLVGGARGLARARASTARRRSCSARWPLALLPCHRFFYRRSSLLRAVLLAGLGRRHRAAACSARASSCCSPTGTSSTRTSCGGSSRSTAHAPRSLRALVGAAAWRSPASRWRGCCGPAPPLARCRRRPTSSSARAAIVAAASPAPSAHLALLGDKHLLFHESGTRLRDVRRRSGRSWVAMGDPIGPPDVRRELAWQFRELADRHGGLAVVLRGRRRGPAGLPRPRPARCASSARRRASRSTDFSLEGSRAQGPAQRAEPDGSARAATSRCCRASASPALLGELRAISDAWLASKQHAREALLARLLRPRLPRAHARSRWCGAASASSPSPTSGRPRAQRGALDRPDAPRATTRRPA